MEQSFIELLNKWQNSGLNADEAAALLQYCKDLAWQATLEDWLYQAYNQYDASLNSQASSQSGAGQVPYFTDQQKKDIYNKATGRSWSDLYRPGANQSTKQSTNQIPQTAVQPAAQSIPGNPPALLQLPAAPPDPGIYPERQRARKIRLRAVTLSWAACLLFLIGLSTYLVNRHPASVPRENQIVLQNDRAAPLAATPTISWGNGSDPMAVDQAIKMQGARLHQTRDGALVFKTADPLAPPSKVSVPKGSKPVHIQLPDGTQVWINTGSTLQFPAAFSAGKRTVSLNGEAYFEVVHKRNQVFEVQQGGNTISVLGTHFNINGYPDNPTARVTLLEGLVQINHDTYLHPAEQAAILNKDIRVQRAVDLQQVMAWKNNQFYFKGTSVPEILQQLSRWYNIELVYKGAVPEGHYSGIISRDNSLSQVLHILEAGGLKFKLNQHSLWIY